MSDQSRLTTVNLPWADAMDTCVSYIMRYVTVLGAIDNSLMRLYQYMRLHVIHSLITMITVPHLYVSYYMWLVPHVHDVLAYLQVSNYTFYMLLQDG